MTMTSVEPNQVSLEQLAQAIDHTKLLYDNQDNKEAEIRQLCQEAIEHNFYSAGSVWV